MNLRQVKWTATLIASLLSAEISAHGMWTEERRGRIEVIYGHGAEDNAYDPKRISGAWAYDASGKAMPITVEHVEDHARLQPTQGPAVLGVALDNGYWTQDAESDWHNVGESQVPGALASGRYYKYSLAILEKGARLPELDKLNLAIIPQHDPMAIEVGDELHVQVLVDGRPAEGIELLGDYVNDPEHVVAITDRHGKARIRVRNHGLNVIAASTTVPSDDPDARVRGMFASLSFVSEQHRH